MYLWYTSWSRLRQLPRNRMFALLAPHAIAIDLANVVLCWRVCTQTWQYTGDGHSNQLIARTVATIKAAVDQSSRICRYVILGAGLQPYVWSFLNDWVPGLLSACRRGLIRSKIYKDRHSCGAPRTTVPMREAVHGKRPTVLRSCLLGLQI